MIIDVYIVTAILVLLVWSVIVDRRLAWIERTLTEKDADK